MSIGVGVGDLIKVLELIHQARKRFVDAPSQYDAISKDFHNVILDIDILSSDWEPNVEQREKLQKVKDDSMRLLNNLFAKVDKFRGIGASGTGMAQNAKKAWKRLNWDHSDFQDWRSRLSLHLEFLNAAERQIHNQRFSRLERKTDHITERVDQQHLHEVLDWFGTSDHGSRQSSLLEEYEEGTGEWFLASNEFKDWIKTDGRMLFCPGLPGAGKTFLVSVVIRHLLSLFDKDNSTIIAYHYCDFARQDKETVNLILSSILKQLAQCWGALPAIMSTLYNEHKKRNTQPSLKEITNALKNVISLSSRTFIVIDGLDECLVWRNLMAQLRGLQGVKILATSREIPEIVNDKTLEGSSVLEVHARATDVRKYIDANMQRLSKFVSQDQQRQEEVRAAIIRASGGMPVYYALFGHILKLKQPRFLLVRLQLDSLARKRSLKAFKDALTTLPTGASAYNKAYDDVMKRIESQDEEGIAVAKEVLGWLTFAKRPLRIEELRTAVVIEETDTDVDEDKLMDIEDMVSTCAGLVTINKWNDTVTLIHYTVEEYLRRTWPAWANSHPDAETVIATTCLTYLLFSVFDVEVSELDRLLKKERAGRQVYPLLDYSLDYGALHAGLSGANCPSIAKFRSSPSKVSKSLLLLSTKYGESQGEDTAEWLIEQGVTADVQDSEGRTALHYAVLNDWAPCVESLLKGGAFLKSDAKNMTPFHYTVDTGNEEIARVFLSAGIPVDLPVTRQTHVSSYEDNKAIYGTRGTNQTVVDKSCSVQGLTVLHLAALTGSQKMTKFLLDHGANPNFPSDSGETPLHVAMKQDLYGPQWHNTKDFWNDPDNRVECVLGWIDPEEEEDNYYSTRDWIQKERSEIVDLLFYNPRADINAQDIFGMSPLHIAALSRDLTASVFQKLIDRGADISLCTTKNKTPLHFAIMSKNAVAVSNLLMLGADPMAEDVNGLNTLHYAAKSRHLQILQHLLTTIPDFQREAFLESIDQEGKNALHHLLSEHGAVQIPAARYLLKRCKGINTLNISRMSPAALYLSATIISRKDDQGLLDLLFSYGADISFKTPEGLGLLHLVGTSR
ncbi:hypothetical protein FPCIR_5716 [Fusarium pseudocircinatum]|uniref:NACHT domain-containing protein n=1 Tax=Fusarium pseudocircinatum TaxID=56676 RepID=A0A8H5P969_9HYPO|nr:hypothetical protein FPCIR_5716 [Fusarium pseudocircinatum]